MPAWPRLPLGLQLIQDLHLSGQALFLHKVSSPTMPLTAHLFAGHGESERGPSRRQEEKGLDLLQLGKTEILNTFGILGIFNIHFQEEKEGANTAQEKMREHLLQTK